MRTRCDEDVVSKNRHVRNILWRAEERQRAQVLRRLRVCQVDDFEARPQADHADMRLIGQEHHIPSQPAP
ncbi:MAG: hypothetical protein ABIG44_10870 [Planctomycetota bacterium]